MSSRIHNGVSSEFLEQLKVLRRGTPNNNDIFQFIRDYYPDRTEEQIREIFQIQIGRSYSGPIPNVTNQELEEVGTMTTRTTPETFVTEPYQANIHPVTSEGAKLFLKATQELSDDKKLEIKQEKSQIFIDQVTTDAQNFGWGGLVYGVPYAINNNGSEVKGNLLELYSQMDLDVILKQAYKTWGNSQADLSTALPATHSVEVLRTGDQDLTVANAAKANFYRRVKSRMIAKRVKGYLSLSDWNTLKNRSPQFTWQSDDGDEWDGPTMLWILLNVINPEIKVSVNDLKEQIESARSNKFNHDVKKMTDFMSTKLREIKEKGGTHDDFLLHLYRALESVPNPDFKLEIKRSRREWEKGVTQNPDNVIFDAIRMYNNMKGEKGGWKTNDPKDAKIVALTTRLDNMTKILEAAFEGGKSSVFATSGGGGNKNSQDSTKIDIEDWRKKKGKDSVERDGKTWYWCPHHKFPGQFDGLYVTHPPDKHDEWKQKKAEYRKSRGKKDKDNSNGDKKKLTLNGSLKAALTSCTNISGEAAKNLIREYKDSQGQDFQ